jgi:chorismate dehydratase
MGKISKVVTNDKSITYYNEEFDDHYHSISAGALTEALEKHVKPAKLRSGFRILDICFGLGYNSLIAIHTKKRISIIGLESDKKILEMIQNIKIREDLKSDYKKIQIACKKLAYSDESLNIKIILGDALKTIKQLEGKFDVVFFDPFSPKKQPEMWTKEFFSDIFSVMNKGAILTTYSCSKTIRQNLNDAGFVVIDGPIVGRKSPGTIAIKE